MTGFVGLNPFRRAALPGQDHNQTCVTGCEVERDTLSASLPGQGRVPRKNRFFAKEAQNDRVFVGLNPFCRAALAMTDKQTSNQSAV